MRETTIVKSMYSGVFSRALYFHTIAKNPKFRSAKISSTTKILWKLCQYAKIKTDNIADEQGLSNEVFLVEKD